MLASIQDNQKFKLKNQASFIINNNSNVFITKNNTFRNNKDNNIITVTINKGNSVNLATISSNTSYDILYGNSTLYSKKENFKDTKHQYLIDYNFPAARSKIHGYKSNYAILLNNGISAFWTDSKHGVLIDSITTNNIDYIPTRLNGYTATINNFSDTILEKKYNGTLVINNVISALTADFIYNLQLKRSSNTPTYNDIPFYFSNITYLKFEGSVDTDITLKNVKYSLLNTNRKITLQNSNIAVNNISQISNKSYNTTISYNVDSMEYRNYIYKGSKPENVLIQNINKNIFSNTLKFEKQLAHPINSENGYVSNLPIGAILWYPQVWSAFNPTHDKYNVTDLKYIILRGEPNSYDWELCDGRKVPDDCLYKQIYDMTNTPNYIVDEKFYKDQPAEFSGLHYLTQPSIVQFMPSSVVTCKATSVQLTRKRSENGGNKHQTARVVVYQNLNGAYDLQMSVFGNWRVVAHVNVDFTIDFNTLNFPVNELKEKFAIQFDSYCCMGPQWWKAWTGGNIENLRAYNALPTSIIDGQTCIGGWPQNKVTKNGYWADTVNTPKLALSCITDTVQLTCVEGNSMRLLNDTTTYDRAWYTPNGNIVNMWLYTGKKGKHDKCRECHDHIITKNLPYHLKTYQIKLKDGIINQLAVARSNTTSTPSDQKITFRIAFQLGLPSTHGYGRSKGWDEWRRWDYQANGDGDDSRRLYHQFWQADAISMFSNINLIYGNMKMKVVPTTKGNQLSSGTLSWDRSQTGETRYINLGTKGNYHNFGLFRRLNPFIKINDKNEKRKNIDDGDNFKIKQWKDPVDLIKVRNIFNHHDVENLNINSITNNLLSQCYCLDDWNHLNNNIVDWSYKIEREDLENYFNKEQENVLIYTEGNELNSHLIRTYGNVYSDDGDEFFYIELLNHKQPKNLFDFNPSFNTSSYDEEDTDIDYTNINHVIDITDQVSPDITSDVENDRTVYFYKGNPITNVINGASVVVDSKDVYYDYLDNRFYSYNNGQPVTESNITYWYNGTNITSTLTTSTGFFNFELPNGSTVKVQYDNVHHFFYYKKTKKIKVNVNNIVLDHLYFMHMHNGENLTELVREGNHFTYNDGNEEKEVFYSKINGKYFIKDRINQYINFNIDVNKLHVYHDSVWETSINEEIDIPYTYYNIKKDSNNNYCISPNVKLIKLASNYKMLQNAIQYINTEIISNTLNTTGNSLPIFYNENRRLNRKDIIESASQGTQQSEDIINNGLGVDYYYLLGTENRVMEAHSPISSFFYEIEYENSLSSCTIKHLKDTWTTFETLTELNKTDTPAITNTVLTTYPTSSDIVLVYPNTQNGTQQQLVVGDAEANFLTALPPYTSAYLPNTLLLSAQTTLGAYTNPSFEQGNIYHLSTYLSSNIAAGDVNSQIYNYIKGVIIDIGNHINSNNINTIDDLKNVQYDIYFADTSDDENKEYRNLDTTVNFVPDQSYGNVHQITKF